MKIPAQRYGETRSGQPICTYTTVDPEAVASIIADFSPADSFDAVALFQYLLLRELRLRGNGTEEYRRYTFHEACHARRLSRHDLAREKLVLSLVTSIAIVRYGKSRADQLFVD